MRYARFARYAAELALFYGTFAGLCQSIPAPPETSPESNHSTPVSSAVLGSPASDHISVRYVSIWTKKDGQIPKDCQDVLQVLLPNIRAYPHPQGWTWFVACDETSWTSIRRDLGETGVGILAITNRPGHSTIIRGSAMLHPYSDDYRAQPEHIVAHELCHIYLQSSDEAKVDELATRWLKERKRKLVDMQGR